MISDIESNQGKMRRAILKIVLRLRKYFEKEVIKRRYHPHVRTFTVMLAGILMRPDDIDRSIGTLGRIFSAVPSKLFMVPIAASLLIGGAAIQPMIDFINSEYGVGSANAELITKFMLDSRLNATLSISALALLFIWMFPLLNWPYYKMAIYFISGKKRWGPSLSYFVVRSSSAAIWIGVGLLLYTLISGQSGIFDRIASLGDDAIDKLTLFVLIIVGLLHKRFTDIGDIGISDMVGNSIWKRLSLSIGLIMYLLLIALIVSVPFRIYHWLSV